jgi:hypothetical protein
MNTKLLALASALAASLPLASVAEAGGGVRLGFGGPLGTFVATPSHGGGASGYQAQQAMPKKRLPVQQAARPEKSTPRVAKTETSKSAGSGDVSKPESVQEDSDRVTGSSALIQGSIPAEETAPAKLDPAPDVKAEASSGNTVTAAAPVETAPQTAPAEASDAAGNCKKFIPAVGTTISVGCND